MSVFVSVRVRFCVLVILATILPAKQNAAFSQNVTDLRIDASGAGNTSISRVEVDGAVEDTPVLNIATPNAAGLSQNFFTQYDIGPEGLVINNYGGDGPVKSDLAGAVLRNPNLSINREASIILNEVTSSRRSNLFGPQELVGKSANFILANPNGVTCKGCGFLNFPRASIITGKSSIGVNGNLGAFDVDGGDVIIEGDGLRANAASGVDFFDIVSRSIVINGQINAKNLRITSGRNMYDYGTGLATPKADDPSGKPVFGIDSTALGGMYADRITLIGTENGVGVRLKGKVSATAGDMMISASGKLVFKNTSVSATGKIRATSSLGAVEIDASSLTSGENLEISAASFRLLNGAIVNAGDNSTRNLSVNVTNEVSVANSFLKSNGSLEINAATISIDSASAGTSKGIQAIGDATLTATDTIANAGFVAAGSKLTLEAWNLIQNVTGGVLQGGTEIRLADGAANAGKFENDQSATVLAPVINAELREIVNKGTIIANSSTEKSVFLADTVTNEGDGDNTVSSTDGLIFAGNGIDIFTTQSFANINDAFLFASTGDIALGGSTAATAQGDISNENSSIESLNGNIRLFAKTFENTGDPAVVTTGSVTPVAETGFGGSIIVGSQFISIVSTCGSFDDPGFRDNVGKTCARSASVKSQTITESTTDYRSRLFAGNDIEIFVTDSILNKTSIISAANDVTIDGSAGATFTNQSQTIFDTITLNAFDRDTREGSGPFRTIGKLSTFSVRYGTGANLGTFCVSPGKMCFTFTDTVTIGGTPILADKFLKEFFDNGQAETFTTKVGILSSVEAGNTLTANLTIDNVNAGAKSRSGFTTLTAATTPIGPSPVSLVTNSPLFVPNQDPTARFLFQTDPRFSISGLLGSIDFLAQIGYDANTYQFLGDAYYEQQYLRQQILSATGQRFLADGQTNENEQYKDLLTRGDATRKDFNIKVGVALTPDQIASLQTDIVLLVETKVNGKTVLAPKLYLAASTDTTIVGGALLAANNVIIKTDGSVTNQGTILASNKISIDAGETVTNEFGKIDAGNELKIAAVENITNLSGTLSAKDIELESTEGSVINKTLKRDTTSSNGNMKETEVGDTATIQADGNLTIRAKDDIISTGGEISSGGDVELSAKNVTLEGIEKSTTTLTKEQGEDGSTTRTTSVQTEIQGAGLKAEGNLTVNANNELKVSGSSLEVKGDAELNVDKLTIEAQKETVEITQKTEKFDLYSKEEDGTILLFREEKTELGGTITSGQESTVSIGGDLTVQKTKDEEGNTTQSESVTVTGSEIKVAGDATINSGIVTIEAGKDKAVVNQTTTVKGSILGGETRSGAPSEEDENGDESASASGSIEVSSTTTTTEKLDAETLNASKVEIGGSLTINSKAGPDGEKSDIKIIGSEVDVEGSFKIDAENITVETAKTDSTYTNTTTKTTGSIGASISTQELKIEGIIDVEKDKTTVATSTNTGSKISAGDIEFTASGTVTDKATEYDVRGDIVIKGEKGVKIEAATDTQSVTVEGNNTNVTLGAKLDYSTVGNAIDDVQDKVLAEEEKRKIETLEQTDPVAAAEARENSNVDTDPELDGLNPENIDNIIPGATISASVEYDEVTDTIVKETAKTSTLTSETGSIEITSGKTGSGIKLEGAALDAKSGVTITAEGGSVDIGVAETKETRTTTTVGGAGEVTVDLVNRSGSAAGEGYVSGAPGDAPNVSITKQQVATINSGEGKVTIVSEAGDTVLTGTKIDADKGIDISGKNVELNAASDSLATENQSTRISGGISVGKNALSVEGSYESTYSKEELSIAKVTELGTANGDITINATGKEVDDEEGLIVKNGNVASEGTKFSAADGTVSITGQSVDLNVARNTYGSNKEDLSIEAGVGATGANSDQIQENVDTGVNTSGRSGEVNVSVGYRKEKENTSQAVDGTIDAKNLTITATNGDATLTGGDIKVAGDTKIDASGGKVALKAAESTYEKTAVNVDVSVSVSIDKATEIIGEKKSNDGSGGNSNSNPGTTGKTTGSNNSPARPTTAAPATPPKNTNTSASGTSGSSSTQDGGIGGNANMPSTSDAGKNATDTIKNDEKPVDPGIIETLLAGADISASVSVEDTEITKQEGGNLKSGGRVDIAGEGIEIEGTQIDANGGSLDAKDNDIKISSVTTTIDSNQTDVTIGVSGSYSSTKTTKTGEKSSGTTGTDTSSNNAPARPSTPAPQGTTDTSSNNAPPRPSTPAPQGTTDTSSGNAPSRPSTPAPATPPGQTDTAAANLTGSSQSGDSASGSLGVSVSVVDVDSTTNKNAKINFGTEEATIKAENVTIEGGKIEGSDISAEISGNLKVKSVADSVDVNATEFKFEITGSKATIADADKSDNNTSGNTSSNNPPARPSTPAPSSPPNNANTNTANSSNTDSTGSSTNSAGNNKKEGVFDIAGLLQTGVDIELSTAQKTDTTVNEVSGITATDNLNITVGKTTTVEGGVIAAGENGNLDLTTRELVVGEDIKGSKSQSLFNFKFAATATNVQQIAENWDTTEGNAFAQQGFLKAGAQADSSSSGQTVKSTIGQGTVTVTNPDNSALSGVNRDTAATVETTGEYRPLATEDTNVLKGDIAQDAIDDLNTRIDTAIEGGAGVKEELEKDIALASDSTKDIAETVARAGNLTEAANEIVKNNPTKSTPASGTTAAEGIATATITGAGNGAVQPVNFANYFGSQVTNEQSVAANNSPAVRRAMIFSEKFNELQSSGKQIAPADIEAAFKEVGITVDLVNAADPQAVFENTRRSLVQNASSELSGILGQPVQQSQIEALLSSNASIRP